MGERALIEDIDEYIAVLAARETQGE